MKKKSLVKILSLLLSVCIFSSFLCACTDLFSTDSLSHTHTYNNRVIEEDFLCKEATCEEPAEYFFSCSCGKKSTKTFEYGEGLGHIFSEYISNKNATYTKDGTKTATCSRNFCNETDTITDLGSKLNKIYTVSFYNNGTIYYTKTVEEGSTVSPASDPQKQNYMFTGWYTNPSCDTKYDFSKSVTSSFDLYAGFTLDAVSLTNTITLETMDSIVKVYSQSYNTDYLTGTVTDQSTSQGSGFCFLIQNGTYYFITNCHVALKSAGYDNQTLIVEDYKGNRYDASIYSNSNKLGNAISAEYDLAVVKITPDEPIEIEALTISSVNPEINEDVISLGAPEGQTNSITYGKIFKYGTVTLNDTPLEESNVTFEVAHHDAKINHGSSGGPLLNANLIVVGVNYAGVSSTGAGRAIPAEKVQEFLNRYVYS